MEGLEILIVPAIACELEFSSATVVAITGKEVKAHVDNSSVAMWSRITVPSGGRLRLEVEVETETSHSGFRVYLSIRGGLPSVPIYLGLKSISMGLGGYQGRSFLPGDQLAWILIPTYSSDWIIHVLSGPQEDKEFLSSAGQSAFYSTKWHVDIDSNRLGIRLSSSDKIQWARENGGQGGSHPSNILDNGYTLGAINLNGDTPVILTNDGPDMGGFLSVCTVASAEMWKLGQVQPGNTILNKGISWSCSKTIREALLEWDRAVQSSLERHKLPPKLHLPWDIKITDDYKTGIIYETGGEDERVIYRQAGDAAILVDFGAMKLDLNIRTRMHVFQKTLDANRPVGLRNICPCIRSVMGALERYMATMRRIAVYLPSNIEYLASNNGLKPSEALSN
ncbi:hypothetical protein C0995_007586 [Termitomyces sp. Mi166|nr:hypothetical protein C0995_007586 [Termitomyces sp. Mi166\